MARTTFLALTLTVLAAAAGCQTHRARDDSPQSAVAQKPAAPQADVPAAAIRPEAAQAAPPSAASTAPPAHPAPATAPKPNSSTSKTSPKPSSAATGSEPKPSNPATVSAAPAAPKSAPLDLNSLEQRLKDRRAIGVFTKLSLKNQVDDLLGSFREFHKGSSQTPPPVLRQKFDLLILKVLSLLQDGDPSLASAISSSREALWQILVDPNKFAKI
jgi:hypothetical protein